MIKINKLLPFTICFCSLATACSNKPAPATDSYSVTFDSTTLNIDTNTAKKNADFVAHITVKDQYVSTHILPYDLVSVKVGANELTYYTDYTYLDGVLTIFSTKVNDNITIVAEAYKACAVNIDSKSLDLSSHLIANYVPIYILPKYSGDNYKLPYSLSSVKMGNKVLNKSEYTYNCLSGSFIINIDITAAITIKAELSVKHVIHLTSDNDMVVLNQSPSSVESSDETIHMTNLKIKDDFLASHTFDDTKEPVITLNNKTVAIEKYEVSKDLTTASISYKLPISYFEKDDVKLEINISCKEITDPHHIVLSPLEIYKSFKINNKNPIISKDRGIDIEIAYVAKEGEPEKRVKVPDDGFNKFVATLTDSQGSNFQSKRCFINNGNLVFNFAKLNSEYQGNFTLTISNFSEDDYVEPSLIKCIEDATSSNEVEFNYGFVGIGYTSLNSILTISPKDGFYFKDNLKISEIENIIKTYAKDASNHSILEHEINSIDYNEFDQYIKITFNLRDVYDKIGDYLQINFAHMNDLIFSLN